MCYADNEKREKRKRTIKSGKHQNARGEGKLQVPRNIKSRYHQKNSDEGKKKKRKNGYLRKTKNFSKPSSVAGILLKR